MLLPLTALFLVANYKTTAQAEIGLGLGLGLGLRVVILQFGMMHFTLCLAVRMPSLQGFHALDDRQPAGDTLDSQAPLHFQMSCLISVTSSFI